MSDADTTEQEEPNNASPLLQARDLYKSFATPAHELKILSGVNLTLERGVMAALLGVSGTGKSTLIQILGSLDRPDSGTVHLAGVNLFELSESERAWVRNQRISFVYQSHRLLPEFNALENVMLPLLIGRVPKRKARERASTMLEDVGLKDRMTHKPGTLSGGEQQRVAIARAIVTEPDLLLADEPTGNLDERTQEEIFTLLRQLNQEKRLTCLMVTHNAQLAARLDRRLRLSAGQLQEDDPTQE